MIRKYLMALLLLVTMNAVCAAESMNLQLSVGSNSVFGAINAKRYTTPGFYQVGGAFVYTDDDDTEYKLGSLHLTAGSDTVAPGLTLDAGVRGIVGDVEDGSRSGDVGAVGFVGNVNYLIAPDVMPIPLEFFSSVTWAPSILSFEDADGYFELTLGVGVRIIENVSVIGSYTKYRFEMESGPGDWTLNDDVLHLGMVLYF